MFARPADITRRAAACCGLVKRVRGRRPTQTAERPPLCASGGDSVKSMTPLKLSNAAPPRTPTSGCPKWRSYATPLATSSPCRPFCAAVRTTASTPCWSTTVGTQTPPAHGPTAQTAWRTSAGPRANPTEEEVMTAILISPRRQTVV